jgi:hypothetical protein
LDEPATQGLAPERTGSPVQAVRASPPAVCHFLKEFLVSDYLYACGQHVTFTGRRVMSLSWTGDFVITKLLPSGGEEPRYEIRRAGETHSRAALESDLTARSEKLHSSVF